MTVYICAVADCKSSSQKKDPEVKGWARFPKKKEAARRRLWVTRCKRGPTWKATRHHALCSNHFIDWNNGPSPSHPDPELFGYNQWRPKNNAGAISGLGARTPAADRGDQEPLTQSLPSSHSAPALPVNIDFIKETDEEVQTDVHIEVETWAHNASVQVDAEQFLQIEVVPEPQDHTYSASAIATTSAAEPKDVGVQVEREADLTEAPTDQRARTRGRILASDKSVQRYTGLPNKSVLISIYQTIKKRAKTINYWKGPKSIKENLKKGARGRKKILDTFDEYLITLVYIRQGFPGWFLGDLFAVSQASVSCITNTWINVLYEVLQPWLLWPSAQQVRDNLPDWYPVKYADTRVILDCTEIYINKPANCSAQAMTYSMYKHHNTAKVLVGITPTGIITFVSTPYGGNTSDRHIAEVELIDKIEPGDAVMVDRGFNIGDLLLQSPT
ncbi:uncharacterized protein LOC126990093 [Eriocheir sinensis]|uniref:uncharacterized protein LOC126990093 n=1 Tax=Eriocheir sinensis TaxID=95602 RepID=UPI0021C8AC8B|nr:uncharacterized protein LOC126990093 [Eriocheir sinensis]